MKTFAIDACLFLFVYVPLTYLVGVPGHFYLGEGLSPGYGYDLFLWLLVLLQVIVPSALVLCVVYWVLKGCLRGAAVRFSRLVCVVVVPSSLALTQWVIWGSVGFSYPLLLAVIMPAVVLGYFFRIKPIS